MLRTLAMVLALLPLWAVAAESLTLTPEQSTLLNFDEPVLDAFVANSELVRVHSPSDQQLLIYGRKVGRTDLVVTAQDGRTLGHYRVQVVADLAPLKQLARQHFPQSRLTFSESGGAIVVAGEVTSPLQAHEILAMVEMFAKGIQPQGVPSGPVTPAQPQSGNQDEGAAVAGGGSGQYANVINQLRLAGSDQINISVRIVEMQRTTSEQLGLRWSAMGEYLQLGVSPGNRFPKPAERGSWGGKKDVVYINAIIDALVENSLVNVLAEPNLTAKSGEAATFMSGGEFPFPVGNGDNGPEIEFKKFGISLELTPTLLDNNRISLTVSPEVSTLSRENSVSIAGVVVPGIETRRTTTTIELADGQSFALAGLVRTHRNQSSEALPFLGEIPGLAPLFGSNSFKNQESELVIIATARLVQPTSDPLSLSTPLDHYRAPSRFERLFFTDMGSTERPGAQATRLFGNYGYSY
ncbi:type 4 pilus assembly secretin FlpC [Aeromonas piscicola]|uniref:type 4 pilus assembly secretin FlpC n=1 Tax=Aeromonas piscicola TaxID=600645 RepID=UPI0028E57653|nr:type 4 pilus assembly secretin FlpC [Aeromonas piscicola]